MKKLTTYIVATLSCIYVNAQQAFTNSGYMQIYAGASIAGFGNFSNTSAGALVNNGSFYIKQNLTNDQASMAVGTGTLYLNGSVAQTVSGSQTFKTYNFISNNSNGITLNNNLSVSGTHTFTSGMITTSATPNYLVYEAGSSCTGDGDTRHVNGWVKKYGNSNFSFPVGDATYERTAAITNLAGSSEINCHYYTPTANIYNLFSPLVQVHANEYWQINEISGGNVQVTLNWDNAKVPFENVLVSEIHVGTYLSGKWRIAGGTASGNILTTGSVTSWPGNSFSVPFTFGFTAGMLLPLKIISFTAERRSGSSLLHWVTENEQNVDHFDIQRSYDATTFTSIGNTAARNLIIQQEYNFDDHSALNGIAWYRIRSVDPDGKFSYSKIVAVTERQTQSSGFLVVNPARNVITIFNKTGENGLFNYRLLNTAGQQVLKGSINMDMNGGAVLPLPPSAAEGIYIMEISKEQILFLQKILVER